MSSSHDRAIANILKAASTSHFDVLQLPRPHADLIDKPVWECTDEEIGRAFRKRSLACHPDKSTHPDAPRAFEILKKAKICLLNPLTRHDYLVDYLRREKTAWEGKWGSAESAGAVRERVTAMRGADQQEQGDSVVDAMRERRARAEQAARKKQFVAAAQARAAARNARNDDDESSADESGGGGGGGGGSGSDGGGGGCGSSSAVVRPAARHGASKKRRFL
jgi:DnaJ family protein C protein 8